VSDWSWLALAGLGAYHGINPAMGWLFAVSQGLQQRERRAVLRSLVPIAAGHEASLLVVAAIVLGAGAVVSTAALRIGAAVVLIAFGIFRFAKPRAHFRWTTMRVTAPELGWWSFLMATAHGAGLMVAPVLIGGTAATAEAHDHELAMVREGGAPLLGAVGGLLLHVTVMLVVMGFVAVVVYDRLGVEVLRRAWLNTEQIWAVAFVFAGVVTLLS
jgi:hypothetical protein